ncbi:MAG: DNA polymerase III subunit beta [Clostridia bacterium]|nr:DNA polymerase III subunit beta [Clostridia bacterium]
MKFVCAKETLVEAIATVQKSIATRTPLPILEGILLEAGEDAVKMTGYDLETGIECKVNADVMQEGSLVINARMFGEIARKLPESTVAIETGANNTVAIDCGSSRFTIKCMPAENYPKLPLVEESERITLPQKMLRDMIRQTLFAVSTDESRPILNGCFIKCDGQVVEMVAIDGFRLALRRSEITEGVRTMSFIVPGKALSETGRILENVDDPVEIYSSQNHILFDTGRVKLVSRLIQGDYMNYRSFIPTTAETTIVLSTQAFLSAMERASLIITSDDRRFPVRLTTESDDSLVVSATTDVGAMREEVPVSLLGNRIDIDFNPRYFLDALKVVDDEEISVVFNGALGACVIRPVEENRFAYLVLPLRK